MTKIPSDEILEGLYKLRIRESEKLKTVLELYDLETHQKKLGPDYHRLKTMVKRSIEQNLRMKNFEARNGNYERNAVVKNQRVKHRDQRSLVVGNGKPTSSALKETSAVFRHDMNKRAKSTQPSPSPSSSTQQSEKDVPEAEAQVEEWLDCRAKITLKELAPIHSVKSGTLQNACSTSPKKGCRFGKKCSYAHRQVDEQPSKRSKKNGDKSAVAMLEIHDNWVAYVKIWSRRSLLFCGRVQTYGNQSNVWNSWKLLHVTLKFETKIHRLEWFAQVILISVTPMLQNLRIGLRKRRSGKSDVPAKQRGSWPKIS